MVLLDITLSNPTDLTFPSVFDTSTSPLLTVESLVLEQLSAVISPFPLVLVLLGIRGDFLGIITSTELFVPQLIFLILNSQNFCFLL